jgi:hypothetical protein
MLGAIAVAIVFADLLVVRRSRPVLPRPRRKVPPALLFLLRPIYHHDHARDAWILRAVGDRWGPVLRPNGRGTHPKEGWKRAPDLAKPADSARRTPDPFDPAKVKRTRTRRNGRTGKARQEQEQEQEQEPPPLIIRRRPE